MPKKTRKQKLMAEKRRKEIKISPSIPYVPQTSTLESNYKFSFNNTGQSNPVVNISRHDSTNAIDVNQYAYVYHDLLKISIFALLAFGAEIVLVFLLRTV